MRPDLSALRQRMAEIEARKPLNRAQALAVLIAQAGGSVPCGCGCGEPLDPLTEGVVDEHVRALALLGTNDLENRAFYRKPCAKKKTAERDLPNTAKAKRMAKTVGPREPSKHPIPAHVDGLRGGGFNKAMSRGFDGKVRPRKQRKVRP